MGRLHVFTFRLAPGLTPYRQDYSHSAVAVIVAGRCWVDGIEVVATLYMCGKVKYGSLMVEEVNNFGKMLRI